jgi:hypothetical protein
MEIERNLSKELHKHSLNFFARPGMGRVLGSALVTHVISVKPERNGLARISASHTNSQSKQTPPPTQSSLGADGATAGESTQFNLAFSEASQSQ